MKVALIYSFSKSSWFSCTIINKNIRKAYDLLLGEENIIHIHYGHDRQVSTDDIKYMISEKVDKIIFIDHKPTPINFLQKYSSIPESKNINPEFIIHVFGDYPLYLREWRSVNELLEGKKVKYICASQKQKLFVEKFVVQKEIISVCPFPVNTDQFNHNTENRDELRETLGIDKADTVLLYTGRLSYQKRLNELIWNFKELIKKGDIARSSKLVIVGEFDNLGFPYLDQQHLEGEYFRMVDKELSSDPELKQNIILTGKIENQKLNDYYNMADYYVSLSTYHDEDYGMSVAEAACSGLPLILTNWAGYYSFQLPEQKEYCRLIPVELTKSLPHFDNVSAQEAMKSMIDTNFDHSEVASTYSKTFSITGCSKRLGEILDKESESYKCGTDFMVQVTNHQFIKNNQMFMSETSKEFKNIYYKAYDVYAR